MRRIARAAGMSVGGLYLYFRNKEDLFVSIVEERVDKLLGELKRLSQMEKDPVKMIRETVKKIVEHAEKNRDFILIFTNMEKAKMGRKIGRRVSWRIRSVLEKAIRLGVKKGVFKSCPERDVALTINSALIGQIMALVVEKKGPIRPEVCSELFLEGLLKRERI